jgi:hypothetical protein
MYIIYIDRERARVCIHIYIYREREGECIDMYECIYLYSERDICI